MKYFHRFLRLCLLGLGSILGLVLLGALGIYIYLTPQLPDIETLKDVHLQVPLRVYTSDLKLVAEFGEMKRTPLKYQEIPALMVHAVLAAEADRYFKHPAVAY